MELSNLLTVEEQEYLADLAQGGTGEKRNGYGQGAENKIKPFPEAAWTGLFEKWRDTIGPTTEAPLENLWAVFVVSSGLALGRTVRIENPKPIYPNFYSVLLGNTASSKKTTCLWYGAELLRRIGEDQVKVLTGIVSSEGLFEELAAAEGTRALIFSDEFRSLLSVAKNRKATQDLLPKLNSLYSCPYREGITRREKSTQVVAPFVSLLTATPVDYVETLLDHLDVSGGFINRFLVVAGNGQQAKPRVKPPTEEQWRAIANPLREVREFWIDSDRSLDFSAEASELWNAFYIDLKAQRESLDYRAGALTARTDEHVLKLALLYGALNREREISAESLATAIKIGGWLQATTLRLFGNVGLDPFSRAEKTVLETVKRARRTPKRELQQAMFKRGINGKVFGDVLRTLEANELIRIDKDPAMSGQTRLAVVYMGTPNS